MVMRRLRLSSTLLLSALLLALAYDGFHLAEETRFNRELEAEDGVLSPGLQNDPTDSRRQFANAYALQGTQDFKAAVKAYAAIDAPPQSRLMLDIKYNLANLFFRESAKLGEAGDDDLAMPLMELAKQNYREILSIESGDWDAKYNLELALIVAPETDPADALEERNPEHSVRALTIILSRDSLP